MRNFRRNKIYLPEERMRTRFIYVVITFVVLLFLGCGATIYVSPDFAEQRASHKIASILPFEIIIDPNKLPKDYTLEMKKDAEKAEAYNFQQELYMQFLKRSEKNEYTIKFQDVDKTNALLAKLNITHENIKMYTKEELKTILSSDVLLSGTIHRSKPMSTGTAVLLGVLFGAWGSTNEVNVSLSIHDGNTGNLLWRYDHKASGSVGSSSEKLAESLMKNISKKFPYKDTNKKAKKDNYYN